MCNNGGQLLNSVMNSVNHANIVKESTFGVCFERFFFCEIEL